MPSANDSSKLTAKTASRKKPYASLRRQKSLAKKEKEYAFIEKFLIDTLSNINNVKVKTAVESYEKLKAEYLTDDYEKIGYNGKKD